MNCRGKSTVSRSAIPLDFATSASMGQVVDKRYTPRSIYLSLCINCGGPIEDHRAIHKNACSRCMQTKDIVPIEDS